MSAVETKPAPANPSARSSGGGALVVLPLLLLAGGTAAGWGLAYGLYFRLNHFTTVEEGKLYRSGYLEPHNLERVIEQHGIKSVINLIKGDEGFEFSDDEIEICQAKGVRRIHIPLQTDTPPNEAELAQWLEIMQDESLHPMLVHCQHGVVRTGMFAAVYRVEFQGMTGEQALQDMYDNAFGHDMDRPWRKDVREFVRSYTPRLESKPVRAPRRVD